ncbi:hypothetical protein PR202_ga09428 [Eleusine coracana subsp. coracana]|uniref:Uncharacterized protein n=1 Tax=Eleusine coracana subsp. coracana TaxID=191504 RepID=A0AAV5C4N2_ELECO|nr:hypothetical protein PR202_ga09428 [Eleusine coracana subsp. coracana]
MATSVLALSMCPSHRPLGHARTGAPQLLFFPLELWRQCNAPPAPAPALPHPTSAAAARLSFDADAAPRALLLLSPPWRPWPACGQGQLYDS